MRLFDNHAFNWRIVLNGVVILVVGVALVTGVARMAGAFSSRASAPVARSSTTPTPTVAPTATPNPWATDALSVNGLQIVDTQGRAVTLLGVSRFSLEYACQGDGHFRLSDFQAMRSWGMNTVRIPLSSAFWRDLDHQCPNYQSTVESAVTAAEKAGLYVILDLQRDAPMSLPQDATGGGSQCPLPDATYDVQFWRDVATVYQNDPHVLFDVFGEPHDITWQQWRNGGQMVTNCYGYDRTYTYTAISMPALAAAVRAIAPRNIIILSGVAWGYDLSGLTRDNAPALSNVLYATHPWNHGSVQQPDDWNRAFGSTAQQLPVIATEFGAYDCRTNYISTELTYFKRLGISFLAWAWAPANCATPGLLADWSGTPTAPYGQFIKAQMLAADAVNPAGIR